MTEKENNIEQAKLWGLFFVLIGVLAVVVPKKMNPNNPDKQVVEYCKELFPNKTSSGYKRCFNEKWTNWTKSNK